MGESVTTSEPISQATADPVAPTRFPAWLLAVLLGLATIAIFWPATRCDFVNMDDPEFVTDNPYVQHGFNWPAVKWAFGNTQRAGYWAPLTWLSHALACQLFGLKPWGHHLINILLHAASTVLLFLTFRRMTSATWRSLALAAFFGWHPLRVESVAWVTERKDTLSALFWMLSLWAYVRYVEELKIKNIHPPQCYGGQAKCKNLYALSLLFFACGLMSKAMLVTLPCTLLLLDYWPLERFKSIRWGRLVWEKMPFFVLSIISCVITFIAQRQGGAVVGLDKLPMLARFDNAFISYFRYLGKLFWPAKLAVYYPLVSDWPVEDVIVAATALLAISAFFYRQRENRPYLLMGWLWFVGTLVPVIGLAQSGGQGMADRFTYVPSIGLMIIVIWTASELTKQWPVRRIVLPAAGSTALLLCLVTTRQQLRYWQNSEVLFQHALDVTGDNYFAQDGLATVLYKKGQTAEAISRYQESIRLAPDFPTAHDGLGAALDNMGRVDEAINEFRTAIRLNPNFVEAHNNLGASLVARRRSEEAIDELRETLRLDPGYADAHYNLGNALYQKNLVDEAISEYREAFRLNPNHAAACNNLAYLLAGRGQDLDQTLALAKKAVLLEPGNASYLDSTGWILLKMNRPGEALDYLQQAVASFPRPNAACYDHLGDAYAALGEPDRAGEVWRKSLSISPDPQIQKKVAALTSR